MYLYFCRSLGDVLQWVAVEGSGRMVQFGFHGRNRISEFRRAEGLHRQIKAGRKVSPRMGAVRLCSRRPFFDSWMYFELVGTRSRLSNFSRRCGECRTSLSSDLTVVICRLTPVVSEMAILQQLRFAGWNRLLIHQQVVSRVAECDLGRF